MKTNDRKVATDNLNSNHKRLASLRTLLSPLLILLLLIFSTNVSFAHCVTMDGALIKDAKISINKNNVNYVLKWVQPQYESEIRDAFLLAMKVRKLGPDAQILSDKYFFDTLVRLHREGEGVPFTGVKPSGTPVDEKVLAADKSIEAGNLNPLKELIPEEMFPELESRFKNVMSRRNFDVNNVTDGREYIEAYVQFFKFAEGEEDHAHHESHN